MRLSKVSLVAASLALACTGGILRPASASAADAYWNGGQSGWEVKLVNGVAVVVDAAGNPVLGGSGAGPVAFVGGSGVWDGSTANWMAAGFAPTVKTSVDDAIFSGPTLDSGGVVLVRDSANQGGIFHFFTNGYTLVGEPGVAVKPTSVRLYAGSGRTTIYNFAGGEASGAAGSTLVVNNTISTSIGKLTGAMDFEKDGAGELEYNGFYGSFFGVTSRTGFATTSGVLSTKSGTYPTLDPLPTSLPNAFDGTIDYQHGISGSVTVNRGVLKVNGYLNAWTEFPERLNASKVYAPHMAGAERIVLNGNAELNFTNSAMTTAKRVGANLGGEDGPLTRRYNFANNLMAGLNHDQFRTRLFTGLDDTYRIVLHVDADTSAIGSQPSDSLRRLTTGSVGILAGRGDVIKTGKGRLLLLNDVEEGVGRLQISNGTVVLQSATGRDLAAVQSVNLAGTDSLRGEGTSSKSRDVAADDTVFWIPAVAPAPEVGQLVLTRSTQIRNLQADFAYGSAGATLRAALQKASTERGDEALIAGTGQGSSIFLGDATLTINQVRDGVFAGDIYGAYAYDPLGGVYSADTGAGAPVGNIIKTGAGTLALIGGSATYATLEIREGRILASAPMLGTGTFNLTSGSLGIYQTTAGTLNANLVGSGTMSISTSAFVDNGSGAPIQINSDGTVGTLQFARVQTGFTGTVVADAGVTLLFTSAAHDALANAKAIVLSGGGSGPETTLAIGDSIQHLNNLSGDANTRIQLDRGALFLKQTTAGAFAGKISGVGSLVKDGGATMVLDATKTTYFGATVVSGGTLAVNAANGLQRSSGLILKNGGTFAAGGVSQTFGALYGEAGSTVAMGAGTLTIGITDERNRLLITEIAGGKPLSTNYLGTSTFATLNTPRDITEFDTKLLPTAPVDVADATRIFLRDILGVANAATLDYAGVITGTGGLRKIGVEMLALSGVNTYTGATVVEAGMLRVDADAINASSGVALSAGAVLSIRAGSGEVSTFTPAISGAGSLEKVGAGEATLALPLGGSGDIAVREGALRLTFAADRVSVITLAGAAGGALPTDTRLIVNQPGSVTLGGSLTGDGVLVKEGAGRVAVASTGFTGDSEVRAGTLALARLPEVGDISVAAGAVFEADSAQTSRYAGLLTGAGEARFTQGAVRLDRASSAFTGKLTMTSGELIAGVDDLYQSGVIGLRSGAVFDLNGTSQQLAGIDGAVNSFIRLADGSLRVSTASGVTEFSGMLLGHGNIEKEGAGTFRLTGADDTGWTGGVFVFDGTLEARPTALGAASITLFTTGKLALFNDSAIGELTYATAIDGSGVIGKTGAGTVTLENASAGFTGTLAIDGGELRAAAGSLGGRTFAGVTFGAAGAGSAVYAVALPGDFTLNALSTTEYVTGFGSVAVEGAHTLTLTNGQSYTGNTILRAGAKLDLTDASFGTTLNGLAGQTGTEVIAGPALTLDQNVAGTFAGAFAAPVALTVTNSAGNGAKLKLEGTALANVSTLNLAGGHLVLDAAATTAVALTAGGTFYFDTSSNGGAASYAGTVTGTGTVVKTGSGDLTLDAGNLAPFTHTGRIGVDEGRLTVDASVLPTTITGLYTAGTGTLAISVASGEQTFAATRTLSGPGAVEKVGAGKLILGTAASPFVIDTTGRFTVSAGTLGGAFATAGDLRIASGATLAPGNSPGLVTVNGDLTLAGALDAELTNRNTTAGTDYDRVQVNGNVTLGGVLKVTQFGAAAPVRGQKYAIIGTTGNISGDFASIDPAGRKVIVVTPARNANTGVLQGLGSANEVVVYVVDNLAATAGYTPHEGITGLTGVLDGFVSATAPGTVGVPANRLGAQLTVAAPGSLDATVNALSPLGYGALYAMDRETGLRQEEQIRARLEQRRYDNGGERADPWEAFVVGSGALATNDKAADTPTFDYNTAGGLVGLDRKITNGPVVGAAAGYDSGTANLHAGAGKTTMSRVRGTAFLSTMVSSRWYVDATVSAGVADFDAKRNTVTGRNTASTTGYDYGLSLATGTIVALRSDLHLTPFLAASYAHHEFDALKEKGSESRLAADGWSNDSLRVSVGTGLGWWMPVGDMKLKLGGEVAYNRELMDTESEIDASFTDLGGGKFRTTAAALPSDSISVGPNVSLGLDEAGTISAGYTFELGFDGRLYNAFNIAYRRRF